MRKIYIDCGAYNGDTIDMFKKGKISKRDDLEEFEIFAFDPAGTRSDIIKKAVSDKAGWTVFSYNLNYDLASTIEMDNRRFNNDLVKGGYSTTEKRAVETIDFPEFVKQFSPDSYIILKMDIEGSEFAILEKMIADHSINYIKELYIEFHAFNFPPEYAERELRLKEQLRQLGLEPQKWTLYD